MDTFEIIQQFFTRMPCQFCGVHFEPEDVSLVSRGDGYYLVNVDCHDCGQHNGTAAVGVEMREMDADTLEETFQELLPEEFVDDMLEAVRAQEAEGGGNTLIPLTDPSGRDAARPPRKRRRYRDPEFTEADRARLFDYAPITEDDVLEAHQFIQQLDEGWMRFIPPEIRQRHTAPETE